MTDETNRLAPVQDRHRKAATRSLRDGLGAFLWGSDDPVLPIAQALADAEEHGRKLGQSHMCAICQVEAAIRAARDATGNELAALEDQDDG